VDIPAPPLSDYAEPSPPWRRAAIITAAVAAVELVALVVIALAFIAKPFADDSSTRASAAKEGEKAAAGQAATNEPAPVASLPRAQTGVLVLNGNGVEGAAAKTSEELLALDYQVAGVGDAARRTFPRTIVMYRDGFEGEAVRLARDLELGAKRAVPLDGMREAELGEAELALVLGG
jgi:hypothetical protein